MRGRARAQSTYAAHDKHALCPACAQVEAQAETTDFSRVLLLQQRNRLHRRMHLMRTAIAAIVPGYGLLAHRRIFTPILLLGTTWVLTRVWAGYAPPFAIEPRLTLPGEEVPVVLVLGLLGIVYTVSLLGYFHHVAKEREREAALAAGQRGRITQSTRRVSAMAA